MIRQDLNQYYRKENEMRRMNLNSQLAWLLVAGLSVLTSAAQAQVVGQETVVDAARDAAAKETREFSPEVKKVIERYTEAIGGREKLDAVKSITTRGKMNIPQAGISGELAIYQTADGNARMEVAIPGIGNQQTGKNGETAWENSSVTGPEILEGERKSQLGQLGILFATTQYLEMFDTVELVGNEEFNGESCNVLKMQMGDFGAITAFFSEESGLEVGQRMVAVTAMGEMEVESVSSDYREVDGIKIAHKTVATLPNGMTQEIVVESVEFNSEIPAEKLELPSDIKELVKDTEGKEDK
jgi:hypothetical protein